MIILKYKHWVLEYANETDDCEGCIYESHKKGETCLMSAHINETYGLECAEEHIIYIENILISNLTNL